MAYADPQTINSIALNRVYSGSALGDFVSADSTTELTVDPRGTARRRRNVGRYYKRFPVVVDGVTTQEQAMVSFTIDRPRGAVTDAEVEAMADALIAWLNASSKAALKKLIGGEN